MTDESRPPDDIDPAIRRAIDATQGPVEGPDVGAEWRAMAAHLAESAKQQRRLRVVRPGMLEPVRADRARRAAVRIAAVAVMALGLTVTWRAVRSSRTGVLAGSERTYATAGGERATVRLVDGTEVILAPASQLRVPLDYQAGHRAVVLDGEAYFTVVHDAAHPFAVYAANAIATDIGTAFDVRAYAGDPATRIAVVEGRVVVTGSRGGNNPAPAGAGDIAMIDTAVAVTHGADVASVTAWTHGELVFARTPMRDVFATAGRWYDLDLRVSDPAMGTEPFTGSFSTEPVDQVLSTFALILHARIERDGRVVTFVRAAHH
jgi:ferric-dicitrate binding protein FerR (iron transport regulator)